MNYLAAYLIAATAIGCVLGLVLKMIRLRDLDRAKRELEQMVRGEARFNGPRAWREIK